MAKNFPRCLIGTLYVGENELPECEAAIRSQGYRHWEHFRLDNMPELEAHEALYDEFMRKNKEFDYFIKIDPDMVFVDNDSLSKIVGFMQSRPSLDHACFSVYDYMSQQKMLGMHVYSEKAKWNKVQNHLYPDQSPEIPGRRLMIWGNPSPVAFHSPNPSGFQAFHFGAHRMLKALNPTEGGLGCYQWDIIYRISRHARRNSDPRLRLAVLGAWHVWKGDIGDNTENAQDSEKIRLYQQYSEASTSELEKSISEDWLCTLKQYRRITRYNEGFKRFGRRLLQQ